MRKSIKMATGAACLAAGLALAACGETDTVTEDDTAVTDVDPGEADGTIDDTTAVDGTIGAGDDGALDGADDDDMAADDAAAEEDGDGEAEGTAE